MTSSFRMNPAALEGMVARSGITARFGRMVRDEARVNAREITSKTGAIEIENGADGLGPYTDVGYLKHHPGFFLWWWEVGTRRNSARPHLRPAVRPRL